MNQMAQMAQMAQMMQMNNPNNQTNNQNSNQFSSGASVPSPQEKGVNIVFRVSGPEGQGRPPLSIQCMPNEKISDVIQKYRTKSGDQDQTKKFIFNAKNLNPQLSVGEAGITDNANVFVVTTQGVKGAY